ncbi:uncharacterized protein LOC129308262 [Prosopis cineraria]|uniref:uncharacterized protein LOC129308262 n=1 Tax=Prosopis cineraria TaxID=364024 RepID=UPI00240EA1FB|nr:uncharacterized protein LOC129308262 [Prosopis cineraria]XP_054805300.1 uncharacterized protein LOC129308262 [Prosopis cineraria]XP_054805301.1 uncharacterized protein LOC129308262 [Prosopis cineraria]
MREACVDCAQKCLSIHGKEKTYSNVPSSFFKVMIGGDFSRVLYLPPKFGPTASALVDKEAIIEDSSGHEWTVRVSIVNNSYAFQEGWKSFSSKHGLEIGSFLVFHYIGRSHFVVKIFDKSGCEKIDFPYQRKQKKRKTCLIDLDGSEELLNRQGLSSESGTEKMQSHVEVVGVNSAEINEGNTSGNSNSNGRIRSLYEVNNYEDPCYLTDRDFGDKEREERSHVFDALRYEIVNNSGIHTTGKFTSSNEIVDASIYTKDPLLEEMLGIGATQDPFEVELTRSHFLEELDKSTLSHERHYCGRKIPENLLIAYTMKHEEIKENNAIKPYREDQKCQFAENSGTDQSISKEEYPWHIGNCQSREDMMVGFHVALDAPICHAEMGRMVQKDLPDMTPDVRSHNDQLQSIIGDQGSSLNSVKAEPSVD